MEGLKLTQVKSEIANYSNDVDAKLPVFRQRQQQFTNQNEKTNKNDELIELILFMLIMLFCPK